MGKEKSIHKQIGNAIKAKGLQKLRWYCQLCQKQCRDENGFKCHQTSEGHKRQMMLFGHDPDKFVDDFSQQFEVPPPEARCSPRPAPPPRRSLTPQARLHRAERLHRPDAEVPPEQSRPRQRRLPRLHCRPPPHAHELDKVAHPDRLRQAPGQGGEVQGGGDGQGVVHPPRRRGPFQAPPAGRGRPQTAGRRRRRAAPPSRAPGESPPAAGRPRLG